MAFHFSHDHGIKLYFSVATVRGDLWGGVESIGPFQRFPARRERVYACKVNQDCAGFLLCRRLQISFSNSRPAKDGGNMENDRADWVRHRVIMSNS
jgi:hypothetical protein